MTSDPLAARDCRLDLVEELDVLGATAEVVRLDREAERVGLTVPDQIALQDADLRRWAKVRQALEDLCSAVPLDDVEAHFAKRRTAVLRKTPPEQRVKLEWSAWARADRDEFSRAMQRLSATP